MCVINAVFCIIPFEAFCEEMRYQVLIITHCHTNRPNYFFFVLDVSHIWFPYNPLPSKSPILSHQSSHTFHSGGRVLSVLSG